MGQPETGRRLRSTADRCTGSIQWVDPVHGCMGVVWDDGTTSTEPAGAGGRWELLGERGHGCGRSGCRCPADGERLLYAPAWDEHACPRPGCRYAHGPAPGGGWVGTLPPDVLDN